MGTLEANPFHTLDPVYVSSEDGLADFLRGERGQHHAGRRYAYAGYAYEQAEEFPFVLGGKTVEQFFVFPNVVMNVRYRLCLQLEGLIGLKGNEDAVPDSVVFQNELRRS